jgi:hypothetical protein
MNHGMAETEIVSGEVDLAPIKLSSRKVDRRKIVTYAVWAVLLAAFALVVEQIPGMLLHLAPTSQSARMVPPGYVLNDPHLSLSPYWHIEHLIHAHTRYRSVLVDVSLRFFIAGIISIIYANNWQQPLASKLIRAGVVLMGATLISQAASFLLYGGVVDLLAHTTKEGVLTMAMSFSDLYTFVGGPLLIAGFIVLFLKEQQAKRIRATVEI